MNPIDPNDPDVRAINALYRRAYADLNGSPAPITDQPAEQSGAAIHEAQMEAFGRECEEAAREEAADAAIRQEGVAIEDDEYLKASVAFILADELQRSGITQRALAERIGVTEARISHIMNAEGNLTLRTLARIGTALGRKVRVRFFDEYANPTPPMAPPDLVALVEAFGIACQNFGEADSRYAGGDVAEAQANIDATRDALLAALGRAPAPTGERTDADPQSLALRNCLALARAKMRNPGRPGGWEDVVRFCSAAGVAPDVLRAEPTGERMPSPRWERPAGNRWHLTIGHLRACVVAHPDGVSWRVAAMLGNAEHFLASSDEADPDATNVGPAMLAAEDALLAVRDEITAAVGRPGESRSAQGGRGIADAEARGLLAGFDIARKNVYVEPLSVAGVGPIRSELSFVEAEGKLFDAVNAVALAHLGTKTGASVPLPVMPKFTDEAAAAFLDSLDADILDPAAYTDEEVDAELRAAGCDIDALERRASVTIAALMKARREAWQAEARAHPSPPPTPPASPRRR